MDKKAGFVLFVLKTVVELLVLICFNHLISPLALQHDFIASQKYDIVYEYKNDVLLDDSFYILTNILSYDKKNGQKNEILMQKPVEYTDYAPFGYKKKLKENEIIISRNIADALSVKVGDYIEFHNPIFDLYYKYIIADVLPVSYGLYESEVDRDMGVIVVGYNEDIGTLVQMDSVLMTDYSFAAGNSGIVLKESHNIESILKSVTKDIVFYLLGGVIILVIIGYVVWRLYCYYGIEIIKRMYIMGSSKKKMTKDIKSSYKYPSFISDVLALLSVSCLSFFTFQFIPLWVLVPIVVDILVVCFLTFRSIAIVRREN